METKIEYKNIDGLTLKEISELIKKYTPKTKPILIINNEVIEIK